MSVSSSVLSTKDLGQLSAKQAVVLCIGLPAGFEFGIDYYSWVQGEKFQGLRFIPLGLHNLRCFERSMTSSGGESGNSVQWQEYITFKSQDVIVFKYNKEKNTIYRETDKHDVQRFKDALARGEFDLGLAQYPFYQWQEWTQQSWAVTEEVAKKCRKSESSECQGYQRVTDPGSLYFEKQRQEETELGMTSIWQYVDSPPLDRGVGAQALGAQCFDRSYALEQVCNETIGKYALDNIDTIVKANQQQIKQMEYIVHKMDPSVYIHPSVNTVEALLQQKTSLPPYVLSSLCTSHISFISELQLCFLNFLFTYDYYSFLRWRDILVVLLQSNDIVDILNTDTLTLLLSTLTLQLSKLSENMTDVTFLHNIYPGFCEIIQDFLDSVMHPNTDTEDGIIYINTDQQSQWVPVNDATRIFFLMQVYTVFQEKMLELGLAPELEEGFLI